VRNPGDEARRRRFREGDPVKILIDRLRTGSLQRWQLDLLRFLDYPPAEELVDWAELRARVGAIPRDRRGPYGDDFPYFVRELVPPEDQERVLLVAGVGQMRLLGRVFWDPMLIRMRRHSPPPVGPEHEIWPTWVLGDLSAICEGRQGSGQAVLPHQIRAAAESLHYHDFGGELSMHHYLNALADLLALSRTQRFEVRAAFHYSACAENARECVRDALEVAQWVDELEALHEAYLDFVEEHLARHEFSMGAIGMFLHEEGIKPYLTRWLLS
jgi:hypothetical protein